MALIMLVLVIRGSCRVSNFGLGRKFEGFIFLGFSEFSGECLVSGAWTEWELLWSL